MSAQVQLVKDQMHNWSLQVTKQLNVVTGNRPLLIKFIKIVSGIIIAPPILFITTQILRKLWYTTYNRYKKYPPGPIGVPFFGCFFSMANYVPWHIHLAKYYGPIIMYPLGPKGYQIMINDMDLVFKLFKNDAFNDRSDGFRIPIHDNNGNLIPYSLSGANGKDWKDRRSLMHNSIMKITDSKFITTHVQNNIKNKILCPLIENAINENNGIWCPREACFSYTFNTVFGASFGPKLTLSHDDENYLEFKKYMRETSSRLGLIFLLTIFSDYIYKWYMYKILDINKIALATRTVIEGWIESAKSDNNKSDIDQDDFKSYTEIMLNSGLDRESAISDIDSGFQGGTNTTAESIELMIYTFAKYPHAQERVYKELRQIFNEADDINIESMQQLNKAHLLRAFIEETWRLKAVCGVPRHLYKDFRVDFIDKNGNKNYYILPKGSTLNWNGCYLFQSDVYGWKSPSKWDIDNYLDDNNKFVKSTEVRSKDPKYRMSIFGFGGRACPGVSLARKEVLFACAILIYKYKFKGPNGDTDFKIPMLFGAPTEPLDMYVERR